MSNDCLQSEHFENVDASVDIWEEKKKLDFPLVYLNTWKSRVLL